MLNLAQIYFCKFFQFLFLFTFFNLQKSQHSMQLNLLVLPLLFPVFMYVMIAYLYSLVLNCFVLILRGVIKTFAHQIFVLFQFQYICC